MSVKKTLVTKQLSCSLNPTSIQQVVLLTCITNQVRKYRQLLHATVPERLIMRSGTKSTRASVRKDSKERIPALCSILQTDEETADGSILSHFIR